VRRCWGSFLTPTVMIAALTPSHESRAMLRGPSRGREVIGIHGVVLDRAPQARPAPYPYRVSSRLRGLSSSPAPPDFHGNLPGLGRYLRKKTFSRQ